MPKGEKFKKGQYYYYEHGGYCVKWCNVNNKAFVKYLGEDEYIVKYSSEMFNNALLYGINIDKTEYDLFWYSWLTA